MSKQKQIQQDVAALAGRLSEDPFAGGGVMMGPAVPWSGEDIAIAERVKNYERADVEQALSAIATYTAQQVRAYLGM